VGQKTANRMLCMLHAGQFRNWPPTWGWCRWNINQAPAYEVDPVCPRRAMRVCVPLCIWQRLPRFVTTRMCARSTNACSPAAKPR
jgi:hypothetical protein